MGRWPLVTPTSPGFCWTSSSTASVGAGARLVFSDAVFAMVANRLSDPSSKRRCVTDWLGADAALPEARNAPSLDRLYRASTPSQTAKDEIEAHLFTELCNLTNLDLRLVCYDLTSTYFEGEERSLGALSLKGLRLQPRSPRGPAPDRDRTARHLRRHPDRPPRLFRQHRGSLDACLR